MIRSVHTGATYTDAAACAHVSVLVSSPQAVGSGQEAVPAILSRASRRVSYRSLCVPDDLRERGVDTLPHSFYAQDALRVWDTLLR